MFGKLRGVSGFGQENQLVKLRDEVIFCSMGSVESMASSEAQVLGRMAKA